MFSEMFYKLWNNGLIQLGIWETVYMTLISSAFAYLIGLPLGVILNVTDKKGIAPHPKLNSVLGFVVNFFRSIPFIILMVAINFEIICKVLVPEAKPALITGAAISVVTILGYSAMAATIGGTGLGQIAIIYGHQRSNDDITWICVFLIWIIVQVIQELGRYIAVKTDKRINK